MNLLPFRSLFAGALARVRTALATRDNWFEAIARGQLNQPTSYQGRLLPGFPSESIQIGTTGQCGKETLREAFVFYRDCIRHFRELGAPLDSKHVLLDFGVGWGRIARFFLRELDIDKIYGIDVNHELIGFCKTAFASNNFSAINPWPPTDFAAGQFNYVVGYSVFSHLSEKACSAWIKEFHRITAPGAILALTTRGRPFLSYCESLATQNSLAGYPLALSTMFDDFDAARAGYDRGEFVHSNSEGVSGGGAMSSEFYGETFISEKYAQSAYSEFFSLERFVFDPMRQTHPILFFRRSDSTDR